MDKILQFKEQDEGIVETKKSDYFFVDVNSLLPD